MPRARKQSRKVANVSPALHRSLTVYALAAGAAGVSVLALASPAEAQIVYTPAHETIGANHKIVVDFNHDGIADLTIREVPGRFGEGSNSLEAVPRAGAGIESTLGVGWAGELRHGQSIGPSARFFTKGPALMANYSSYGDYFSGDWPYAVGSARYLGVRFVINGATHYGWVRMNVEADRVNKDIGGLLTGYAYQTKPNTPILAGATGGGEVEAESEPTSEIFSSPQLESNRTANLGTLALGSGGLRSWRPGERTQNPAN